MALSEWTKRPKTTIFWSEKYTYQPRCDQAHKLGAHTAHSVTINHYRNNTTMSVVIEIIITLWPEKLQEVNTWSCIVYGYLNPTPFLNNTWLSFFFCWDTSHSIKIIEYKCKMKYHTFFYSFLTHHRLLCHSPKHQYTPAGDISHQLLSAQNEHPSICSPTRCHTLVVLVQKWILWNYCRYATVWWDH